LKRVISLFVRFRITVLNSVRYNSVPFVAPWLAICAAQSREKLLVERRNKVEYAQNKSHI
jgi:hypothetical protein